MSVAIRLSRGGAKKRPYYRIVVADSRASRDGKYLEQIGTYNPLLAKDDENRVAITPAGVFELCRHGHEVVVQSGAGLGSSISDEEFVAAGARMLPTADDVWGYADLILKVKEPLPAEYDLLQDGQALFTYLHLAASRACTEALLKAGTTALAYETVQREAAEQNKNPDDQSAD